MRLSVKSLTVALANVTSPVTSNVPASVVLPVDTSTSNFVPTSKVVPSNVRLASSSNDPFVPAITMRLSVKSLTVALASVDSPLTPSVVLIVAAPVTASVVPLNVKLLFDSSLPSTPAITTLLSTKSETLAVANVDSPETFSVVDIVCAPVNASVVPSNVKLALSSSAPAVPASVILPDVRSLIVTLDSVDSPASNTPSVLVLVTSNVPAMLVLPVATSTSNFVPTSNVVPSKVKLISSSNDPFVPAITMRLSIKSLTVNVLAITSPVPFGVILIFHLYLFMI